MTGKENISRLINHDNPERIGLWDFWWTETLNNWIAEGYPCTIDKNGKQIPNDPIKVFNYDIMITGGGYDMYPKIGYSELIEETEEWKITKNGAGASFKTWKNKSGTPEHIDFEMTTKEIWNSKYKHLMTFNEKRVNIEPMKNAVDYAKEHQLFSVYGNIFVFEWLRSTLGDICMYESMLLEPEWIEEMCDTIIKMHKSHYSYIYEQLGTPDAAWLYEDLGYNKGLFCSPNCLKKLIFPSYKNITNWFKSDGIPTLLHSCGNVTEALDMIIDADFKALHPMEVKAGCDILAAAKKYKDKLTFIGGLDVRIAETNDKDIIRKETQRICNEMKSIGAMWVFGTDHSVSPRIKYDSYRYMLDTYRENMYY